MLDSCLLGKGGRPVNSPVDLDFSTDSAGYSYEFASRGS